MVFGVAAAVLALVCATALVDTVSLDSVITKEIEQVVKKDEFVLSLKHIKPRKRLRGVATETLFAVNFPESNQKFALMLDRKTKRVIVETLEDHSKHRAQHFTVDTLHDDSTINSLVLAVNQKQPGAHATLYIDCVSYGMVALPRTMRDMFNNMKDPRLEVFHEKKYPMQVDGHDDIRVVLNRYDCSLPPVDDKNFNNMFTMADDLAIQDDPRAGYDRADIPPISIIDENAILDALNKLIVSVNNLNHRVGEHSTTIEGMRRLIEECELCKQRPPQVQLPSCATHPPSCYPGVRCHDTAEGPRCGSCPPGYRGNGYECHPERSCANNPCFPGVECHNTEQGYQCGRCPPGYDGNGEQCRRSSGCEYSPCAPECTPIWKHPSPIRPNIKSPTHHRYPNY